MIILNNNNFPTCYCFKPGYVVYRRWWEPINIYDDGKITFGESTTDVSDSIVVAIPGAPSNQFLLMQYNIIYIAMIDVSIISHSLTHSIDKIFIPGYVTDANTVLIHNARKMCIVTDESGELKSSRLFCLDTNTYLDTAHSISEIRPDVMFYGRCGVTDRSVGKMSFAPIKLLMRDTDPHTMDIYLNKGVAFAVHTRQYKVLTGVKWDLPLHTKAATHCISEDE